MKAVLKKEAFELLSTFSPLIVALCAGWIALARFEEVLLAPNGEPQLVVLVTSCVVAVYVAFVQYERERWRGTLGFLIHRGLGHRGVFLAKSIVGIVGVFIAGSLPPLSYAAWETAFSPNGSAVQWQRVFELSCVSSAGASAYALAVVTIHARRGLVVSLMLALLGACATIYLSTFWPSPVLSSDGSFVALVLCHGLFATPLLMVGNRLFAGERDLDLPLTWRDEVRVALLTCVFVLLPASAFLGVYLHERRQDIVYEYPVIAHNASSGEFALTVRDYDDKGTLHWLNSFGIVQPEAAELSPDGEWDAACTPWIQTQDDQVRVRNFAFAARWHALHVNYFGGIAVPSSPQIIQPHAFLDRDAGVVRAFYLDDVRRSRFLATHQLERAPPEPLPFTRVFEKPGAVGRFSPRTRILIPALALAQALRDHRGRQTIHGLAACFVDMEEKTLWRVDALDFEAPISALELPQNDRLVGLEPIYLASALREGRFMPRWDSGLVVGEHGVYAWNGQEFVSPVLRGVGAERNSARESDVNASQILKVLGFETDPICPRVEIRDPSGEKILFTHQYEPRLREEKIQSATLQIGSLLRPPPINAISFLRPDELPSPTDKWQPMLEEPLFFGHDRVALWLGSLILTGLQCLFVLKRLRARRARTASKWLWSSLVLLFGAFATILFALLEPRRVKRSIEGVSQTDDVAAARAA